MIPSNNNSAFKPFRPETNSTNEIIPAIVLATTESPFLIQPSLRQPNVGRAVIPIFPVLARAPSQVTPIRNPVHIPPQASAPNREASIQSVAAGPFNVTRPSHKAPIKGDFGIHIYLRKGLSNIDYPPLLVRVKNQRHEGNGDYFTAIACKQKEVCHPDQCPHGQIHIRAARSGLVITPEGSPLPPPFKKQKIN